MVNKQFKKLNKKIQKLITKYLRLQIKQKFQLQIMKQNNPLLHNYKLNQNSMATKTIFPRIRQKKHTLQADNQVKCQEPIIPMSKVCLDVIKKLQTQPYPRLTLATHSTISEALQLYYNQYVKLFKQNQILNDQLASILLERNNLADQYNQIKKMKSYDDNIRRRRRYASQIQRNYHCPMPKCNKGYGSQGSLTHHVRLKHPKFFESGQYQIYLQTYILPKQQIKNQDKQLKIQINVQQNDSETRKRQLKDVSKVEIQDQKVKAKQAKKQESEVDYNQKKQSQKSLDEKKATEQNTLKESKNGLSSLIKQVDSYIMLEKDDTIHFLKEANTN